MKGRILVMDDDRAFCELLAEGLERRGYQVVWRLSGDEGIALLAAEDFDIVLSDLRMRGLDGIAVCERVVANRPDVPVVVITAFGSLETAVAAIRAGAYDFITKPFDLEQLTLTLDRALQHRALRDEVKRLRRRVAEAQQFEDLVGDSPPMKAVFDLVARVAPLDTTVLITGESGTGKELAARALHRLSGRAGGPFVAVNCSAIPETLMESQLFGHARGAFTDARADLPGLLVQASGGTLLLDEIGDLPLALQPKLLRALQERAVRPLGSQAEVPFDIRLLCTTNRDLDSAVEEQRFREDLFYRINVVRLTMPPLRSRGNDVLLLAQHFVERFAERSGKPVGGLSPAAASRLLAYTWPGNVRELMNAMERAVALTRFEQIAVDDLPERIGSYRGSPLVLDGQDPAEFPALEEVERRYILRVLEAAGGNRTLASKVLGLDRKTLYRKLLQYGSGEEGSESA